MAALRVERVSAAWRRAGDPLRPLRLLDSDGTEVAAVSEFLHHMLANDASPASLRAYAYELLAWVRFLHAVDVPWYLASRVEARDFALWLKTTKKPSRQRHFTLAEGHALQAALSDARAVESDHQRLPQPQARPSTWLGRRGRPSRWWLPGQRWATSGARRGTCARSPPGQSHRPGGS